MPCMFFDLVAGTEMDGGSPSQRKRDDVIQAAAFYLHIHFRPGVL